MKLLIDQGNSRCKYLLTEDLGGKELTINHQGVWPNHDFDEAFWHQQLSELKLKGIKEVLVSSVAGHQYKEWFEAFCVEVLGLKPRFAMSQKQYVAATSGNRLTNSYDKPQALGVDRWLAMIAAFEKVNGHFVVLDAGTAITTDWVDSTGMHQGGHIVAGHHLLQQTLLGNTGGVAWSAAHDKNVSDDANGFGLNTSAAVALGAGAMVKGYCRQLVSLIAASLESENEEAKPLHFIITGGGGEKVVTWISESVNSLGVKTEVEYCPNLVFEGISYWFSSNN